MAQKEKALIYQGFLLSTTKIENLCKGWFSVNGADGGQRTVRIGAGFGGPWGIFGELGEIPRALPGNYAAADSRSTASKTCA